MLPEGQYLQIEVTAPIMCLDCNIKEHHLAVANEIVFDDKTGCFVGIDAVVRFVECGHRVPGATSDPEAVAIMLDKYEAMDGY